MTVRGGELAGVVQITAVDRKHVRNIGEAGQGIAHRAGREREVSINNVVMLSSQQLFSSPDSHRNISQHRKEVSGGPFPPEEDGHSNYSYPFLNALCGQAKALG